MSFRLGADVGGTFTDLLLINATPAAVTALVVSVPAVASAVVASSTIPAADVVAAGGA